MSRKPLVVSLAASLLALAACGPVSSSSTTSPVTTPSGPGSSGTGSEESSSSSSSEVPLVFDDALLERFASSGIDFAGTLEDTGYDVTTHNEGFIGKSSYEFRDYDDDNYFYADAHYYKNEDGSAKSIELGSDNVAYDAPLKDNTGKAIVYDDYFANPFVDLTMTDFTEDNGTFKLASTKAVDFARPFSVYSREAVSSVTLAIGEDGQSLDLEIVSAYQEYGEIANMIQSLTLTIASVSDHEELAPFPTESYHADIEAALGAWSMATAGPSDETGYVYKKTMTPLDDETMGAATSESIITYNATMFKADGGLTSDNDWGWALFDDGNNYYFEIVDGQPVMGDYLPFNEAILPWPTMVAAEMFVPTETEGVYQYRYAPTAIEAAVAFLEDPEVISLLYYMGSVSDLTITVKNQLVTNFSYTYLTYGLRGTYHERVSVDIEQFDTATIDYEFKVPVVDKTPLIDTWTGGGYTLVIGEDETTLNGETAELSGLHEDEWGNLIATITDSEGNTYEIEYSPVYDDILLTGEGDYYPTTLTRDSGGSEAVVIPDALIGPWSNDDYTLVISEDGTVTLNGKEGTDVGLTGYPDEISAVVDGTTYYMCYESYYDPAAVSLYTEDYSVYALLTGQSASATIPESIVGTYEADGYTIVVSEDGSLTVNDEPVDNDEWTTTLTGAMRTSLTIDRVVCTLTCYDDGTALLADDSMEIYVELTKAGASVPSIDEKYVGTWKGTDEEGIEHTLIINADGTASLDGESFDEPLEFSTGFLWDSASATIGELGYTLNYMPDSEEPYIRVFDDNYDLDVNFYLSQEVGDEPVISNTFPDEWIGTWTGNNMLGDKESHTLVFGDDGSVTLDGVGASSFVYDEFETTAVFGGVTYYLSAADYGELTIMLTSEDYAVVVQFTKA